MDHLDSDPRVVDWLYEALSIEYVSNKRTGKIRRYFPDFVVRYSDGSVEIVEVKPSRKVGKAVNVKKAEAARTWCSDNGFDYVILTEHDLRLLGIL